MWLCGCVGVLCVLCASYDQHLTSVLHVHVTPSLPPLPYSLSSPSPLRLSSPQLYDLDRGEVVSVLSGHHKKGLYGVRFSKTQENLMGTVSSDHTVRATVVFVYTYLILVLFSFSSIQIVLPGTLNIFMITIFVSFSSSAPIFPPHAPPPTTPTSAASGMSTAERWSRN